MNGLIARLKSIEKDVTVLLGAQEALETGLREIVEIYAGMDGVRPVTSVESYLSVVIERMKNEATEALEGLGNENY